MSTSEQYFSLVRTSKSSWIAVPAHQTAQAADGTVYVREADAAILRNSAPISGRLFAEASGTHTKFTERFPRLTVAMIAFALFTISVTAEVELLRHAGYFWR
jgi:hypothetical protein